MVNDNAMRFELYGALVLIPSLNWGHLYSLVQASTFLLLRATLKRENLAREHFSASEVKSYNFFKLHLNLFIGAHPGALVERFVI